MYIVEADSIINVRILLIPLLYNILSDRPIELILKGKTTKVYALKQVNQDEYQPNLSIVN